MDAKLVYDIQNFYMLMGACNELAEMDYDVEYIMDDEYKEVMDELFEKYNIPLDASEGFPECYLHSEDLLSNYFTKVMCEDKK